MIKKVKGGYKVLSSKGKNLGGPYKTLEEAKKRLRQVDSSNTARADRRPRGRARMPQPDAEPAREQPPVFMNQRIDLCAKMIRRRTT